MMQPVKIFLRCLLAMRLLTDTAMKIVYVAMDSGDIPICKVVQLICWVVNSEFQKPLHRNYAHYRNDVMESEALGRTTNIPIFAVILVTRHTFENT